MPSNIKTSITNSQKSINHSQKNMTNSKLSNEQCESYMAIVNIYFQQYDINHDGHITPEQAQQIFSYCKNEEEKQLNINQFMSFMQKLSIQMSKSRSKSQLPLKIPKINKQMLYTYLVSKEENQLQNNFDILIELVQDVQRAQKQCPAEQAYRGRQLGSLKKSKQKNDTYITKQGEKILCFSEQQVIKQISKKPKIFTDAEMQQINASSLIKKSSSRVQQSGTRNSVEKSRKSNLKDSKGNQIKCSGQKNSNLNGSQNRK